MSTHKLKINVLVFIATFALNISYSSTVNAGEDAFTSFEEQLKNGQVIQDCGFSCAWKWGVNRGELKELNETGVWLKLAKRTAELKYKNELAYYYLAKSALKLGYFDAALIYIDKANENRNGCHLGTCDGINIDEEFATFQQQIQQAKSNPESSINKQVTGLISEDTWHDVLKSINGSSVDEIANSILMRIGYIMKLIPPRSDWGNNAIEYRKEAIKASILVLFLGRTAESSGLNVKQKIDEYYKLVNDKLNLDKNEADKEVNNLIRVAKDMNFISASGQLLSKTQKEGITQIKLQAEKPSVDPKLQATLNLSKCNTVDNSKPEGPANLCDVSIQRSVATSESLTSNSKIENPYSGNAVTSLAAPNYIAIEPVSSTKNEVVSETRLTKQKLQNFSPKYRGTNIDSTLKLAKKLEKELGEKSEFETTAQYEERKNTLTERAAKNEVIFVVAPDKVGSNYDADKQLLTLTTGRTGLLTNDDNVSLRYSLKDAGSYIGENAYGVKRRIFKKREYSLEADFIDFRKNPKQYGDYSWVLLGHDDLYFDHPFYLNTITADVSAADAFQLKGKIAIAYSGKLIPNFHEITTYDNDRPTITDPIETIQVEEKIYFKVEKITAFNFTSGEIIKSFDIADIITQKPKYDQCLRLCTYKDCTKACGRQPMHIYALELKP